MESSRYNYLFDDGCKTLFFNGLTESFFEVSSKNRDSIAAIINNPDSQSEEFSPFINRMLSQGFIVENRKEEEDNVRRKYELVRGKGEYQIMILPTYQCNLRCWYCVQDHANMWMSEDTVKKIKKRIIKQLDRDNINRLELSWFGGEPLMAYNIVKEITHFCQSEANKRNKRFNCTITTNSTLLTPERIEELHDLGVKSYQITIDGDKITHDSVKILLNTSAYEKAIANINLIAKHTYCTLRFNYTKENLNPDSVIADLKDRIDPDSKKNLNFLIYKVWQQDAAEVDPKEVERLFIMSKVLGINPKFSSIGSCYADKFDFDCVFPNGLVGKCDNDNPENAAGRLTDDGEIEWLRDTSSHRVPYEDYGECKKCKYLPYCWGPCESKRNKMIQQTGRIHCCFDDKDSFMHDTIINHIKNRK